MSITKVGPKHQVTIPRDVFERLNLEVGDYLEVEAESGKIVLVPKKLIEKAPVPKLSDKEKKLLPAAKKKIEAIRKDLASAKGLTEQEARVAARVGLIDENQIWWWTEEWQKGERAAEAELRAGKSIGPFTNAEELIAYLHEGSERLKSKA